MRWHEKLGSRLMLPIVGVLGLSIAGSLGWLYLEQQDAMLDRAVEDTELIVDVTEAGLRGEMLRQTQGLTQETIERITASGRLQELSLLSKEGVIRFSSKVATIGERLDLEHPTCSSCHRLASPATRRIVEVGSADGAKVLRSMKLIENKPECQVCHGEETEFLGMLVLDRGLAAEQRRIERVQRSLISIGSTTLVVLAALIFFIVQRLVQRPVDALIQGTRRIRERDLTTRVEGGGSGELAELAGAFNAMVADIRSYVGEIQNMNFELSTLYEIVERVTRTIDLEQLRQIILDIVREAFTDVEATFIAIRPDESDEIQIGSRLAGQTMVSNVLVEAPGLDGLPAAIEPALLKRWLHGALEQRRLSSDGRRVDVPLHPGGRRLGMLSVTKAAGRSFAEAELHLLDALETHISVALENARLYSLAVTDELTRVYTLRYFQSMLEQQVGQYERYGQKSALLMIDVDDFKQINDSHGHPSGDSVLRGLGRILRESVRGVDVVCRYGGEEFSVILPMADAGAAQTVAERIRTAVEAYRFELASGRELRVTVSVGLALCPSDGRSARELVDAADAALYEAKRAGKNRVASAGSV